VLGLDYMDKYQVVLDVAQDHKASGVAWLDEPQKYGPPLVAVFGLKDVDAGEGRRIVGDSLRMAKLDEIKVEDAKENCIALLPDVIGE